VPGVPTTRVDPEKTKDKPKPPWAPPAVNESTWTQGNVAQSKMYTAPASFEVNGAPTTKVLPERAKETPVIIGESGRRGEGAGGAAGKHLNNPSACIHYGHQVSADRKDIRGRW